MLFSPRATSPRASRARARQAGFTLIELLAVIAIISILAVLLLPMTRNAFAKAEQVQGLNNMRQVGVAFRLYTADNDNKLPGRPADGRDRWPRDLAPYIAPNTNPAALTKDDYAKFKVYTDPSDPENFLKVMAKRGDLGIAAPQILSNDHNETSFIMNGYNDITAGDMEVLKEQEIRPNAVERQSMTILLGTPKWDQSSTSHFFMDFAEGPGNNYTVLNLKAHGEGSNYVFLDGSARFIKEQDYMDRSQIPGIRYGDWLWLVNKEATNVIQSEPNS